MGLCHASAMQVTLADIYGWLHLQELIPAAVVWLLCIAIEHN